MHNVEYCHRIAGNACFFMKLHFESFSKVEEFINKMSDLSQTDTHVVFSSVEAFPVLD